VKRVETQFFFCSVPDFELAAKIICKRSALHLVSNGNWFVYQDDGRGEEEEEEGKKII